METKIIIFQEYFADSLANINLRIISLTSEQNDSTKCNLIANKNNTHDNQLNILIC